MRWLANAVALLLLPYVLEGVRVEGLVPALAAALVLGAVNALVRPVLVLVTLPINILTLGLFTLVINALLFLLVGRLVPGFEVHGFLTALAGSILLSAISTILSQLVR